MEGWRVIILENYICPEQMFAAPFRSPIGDERYPGLSTRTTYEASFIIGPGGLTMKDRLGPKGRIWVPDKIRSGRMTAFILPVRVPTSGGIMKRDGWCVDVFDTAVGGGIATERATELEKWFWDQDKEAAIRYAESICQAFGGSVVYQYILTGAHDRVFIGPITPYGGF